jgi:hypothetical protein
MIKVFRVEKVGTEHWQAVFQGKFAMRRTSLLRTLGRAFASVYRLTNGKKITPAGMYLVTVSTEPATGLVPVLVSYSGRAGKYLLRLESNPSIQGYACNAGLYSVLDLWLYRDKMPSRLYLKIEK